MTDVYLQPPENAESVLTKCGFVQGIDYSSCSRRRVNPRTGGEEFLHGLMVYDATNPDEMGRMWQIVTGGKYKVL